ncbi:MAG: hypothetical protein HY365_02235, partial [Candidatus Aenigmarchaeota archaeon]|nr:hypothetical protein [Candidatus Aenigmarchaeota archaeon]
MCTNCIAYGVLGALALILLVDAVALQWTVRPALALDVATGVLAAQYFVGLTVLAAAKYYKCQICCMPAAKQDKKK